ncbi:MAG: ROK family glucokinase [Clostridia bacterium]|nr:ROK family glucokinase [Clostridia bacterium]
MIRIGVDVGGMTTKAGCVDEKGTIFGKVSCDSNPKRGYEALIKDIAELARESVSKSGLAMSDITSVGVGIPGIEDAARGIVPFCTNLYWHEVPLRGMLSRMLEKDVYVGNDATVAALAEHKVGASAGANSSVLVTLGTGVGGGVIIDGKPFTGAHGVATEIGHTIIKFDGIECSCGNRGCWECYASARALISFGRDAAREHPQCMIAKSVNDIDEISAKTVIDCAKAEDPVAVKLFDDYAFYVAVGLVNLINTYDPDVILLGGGVSHAGEFLLEAVKEKLAPLIFFKNMKWAELMLATLGNDAGIIGASMLEA